MRTFTGADRQAMQDPLFAERYRHSAAHDASQDTRFVTAWIMSGTFCRPGCSSRTPRPSRVVFYRSAAAAHAANYTPCPRCQPDNLPPDPALTRGDDLASRALRLTGDGLIDREGVGGVASRLGITSRHLQRVFADHVECGPLEFARAQRAHNAKLLLVATNIPMEDVARAAGFATLRQFNLTMKAMYGVTAGVLRFGLRPVRPGIRESGALTVRFPLTLPTPVSAGFFEALAINAIPEVEAGTNHWYARTVRLPRGFGYLRVDRESNGRLYARLSVSHLEDFVSLKFRLLALFTQPLRLSAGAVDRDEALLRMVISRDATQETSRTRLGGLAATLGDPSPWGTVFPSARVIASAGTSALRGDPKQVKATLVVAEAIASGRLDTSAGYTAAALWDAHPELFGP